MDAFFAAVDAAKAADIVILAVGTDLEWAHEEHDAETIVFSDGQTQLIEQVSAAAKNPVVLVTMTATPLDLTDQIKNTNVSAFVCLCA